MAKKVLRFLSLWLPPFLWAAMIFKFSSGTVPPMSRVYWQDFVVKKVGHMILFATLAVLTYRGLVGRGMDRKKAAILAVAVSFAYGVSDEVHQMFTQGREARFRDTVIDGVGAGIAMYLVYKYVPALPAKMRETLSKIGIK